MSTFSKTSAHSYFFNYTALFVFPTDLLEIGVEVGSGLGLAIVTVSHWEGHLDNRSNVSCIRRVPECASMTVWYVSAWPRFLSVCVLAEFACHLAGGERENKLPPFLGLEVITGLVK